MEKRREHSTEPGGNCQRHDFREMEMARFMFGGWSIRMANTSWHDQSDQRWCMQAALEAKEDGEIGGSCQYVWNKGVTGKGLIEHTGDKHNCSEIFVLPPSFLSYWLPLFLLSSSLLSIFRTIQTTKTTIATTYMISTS
jgi:hypothetical protein